LPVSKKHRLPRAFLIAAVLTLILATAASSSRFDFFGQFTRWTAETFSFDTHETEFAEMTKQPLGYREKREYESIQALCDDFGITAPLFPTWVPERFGEPTVMAMDNAACISFQVNYGTENDYLHLRAYEITSNMRDTEIDTYSADCELIHGIKYYYVSDDNADRGFSLEKVAWQNGQFECKLYGTTTRDEMKQIICSIYEGE
jgi:hypothetical protein